MKTVKHRILVSLIVLLFPIFLSAAEFDVTKVEDANDGVCDVDCSLREAVIAANAAAGDDQINLPAGVYVLDLVGANENAAATGDLDTTGVLTIVGEGAASTIVDGNNSDRVFNQRSGSLSLKLLTVQNGNSDANTGGGIGSQNSSSLSLEGCIVRDNQSGQGFSGGGIAVSVTDSFSMISTSVFDNTAGLGGGISVSGSGVATITGSSIRDNTSASSGAGVFSSIATLVVDQSSIVRNIAGGGFGSGLTLSGGNIASITNSTISENSGASRGGVMETNIPVEFFNVTMVNNNAASVSGIAHSGGAGKEITLKNTILSNANTENCIALFGGSFVSQGHNLENRDSCGLDVNAGELIFTDPLLGALQEVGGGLQAHIPANNSPAINAGDDCLAEDERGFLRSLGGVCDIGAIELGCGDGVVSQAETCDDANQVDDDACTNVCSLPTCDDGVLQTGEICDDNNQDNTDDCLNTCLASSCGDGFLQAGVEACDDGNQSNDDGCSSVCAVEAPADASGSAAGGNGGGCSLVR